ncbi:hypothetical protein ACWC6I_24605 [Streptomyces sp. NPDC001414]
MNPLIGDNVLSALRPALGGRWRLTSRALPVWGRPRQHPDVVHTVEDLVERVLGTSPLPRTDNEVTLLLVGLRRQLPHLERILEDTNAAPDLVSQARRIRAEPLPEGRMPLVILTIRLAEIAQALIDAAPASVVPQRTGAQRFLACERQAADSPHSAVDTGLEETEPAPLAGTPVPDAVRTGRRSDGAPLAARDVMSPFWCRATTPATARHQDGSLKPRRKQTVLTGELMTPLLSTRHPWRLHFGETPLPPMLPRTTDAVRVSMGLGLATLDTMLDSGHRVGPLLCCITHRNLLVPVVSGTAYLWGAAHSVCDAGPALQCSPQGAPQSLCHDRFWAVPPDPLARPTTDAAVLHDSLSLMRTRMRDVARQLNGLRAREMCHV